MIDPIVFEDFNASKTMVSGVMVNTAIYKLAFEQSEHGLAIISLDERRFLDVNARFCRYMSRERDQLIGTQLSVIVGANDFEDIKARLAAYKNEVGGLACCELDVSRYFDEAHQQGFLLITLRDLTEYKTAELLAKSTAEQLEALLDAVPAGIWLAHDQNCNRTSCNQVAREWIQVPEGEGDFFATDAQPANSSWATTLNAGGSQLDVSYLPLSRAARGERVDNFEGQIVLNDGQKRYIFGNARPLFDAQGMPRGAVSAYIDVTDIKRAEARENLLAREVDHRARNVLSVIQAIVQLSTATSLEALKSRIAGRIGSLARAHTLLSDSRWHSVDLRKLISQELEPFGQTLL
jgi:PAS domain-containing protein